jgi:hypothetical protein
MEVWWVASSVKLLLASLCLAVLATAADVPQTQISNGIVKARIYLPDVARGYYRGVRFDWSGVVASLTYKGHEFFGQWFDKYDPLSHDAIMGPVEEFRGEDGGLGYAEAKPNGMFMKIGVGTLRKPDNEAYSFFRAYKLVNPGRRVVRTEADHVDFVHELNDGEGYAYEYTKTLRLPRGKAQLVLEHALKNTGHRAIDTSVYNHDFYMLDHLPTGPDVRVKFLFAPKSKDGLKQPARIEGNEIRYSSEIGPDGASASGDVEGFGDTPADNDIRVENVKAGIGVREIGDHPIAKLFFWSTRTTVCPEVYVHIHVEPGQTFKWRTSYQFYLLN